VVRCWSTTRDYDMILNIALTGHIDDGEVHVRAKQHGVKDGRRR
jgi:hypothetical protein